MIFRLLQVFFKPFLVIRMGLKEYFLFVGSDPLPQNLYLLQNEALAGLTFPYFRREELVSLLDQLGAPGFELQYLIVERRELVRQLVPLRFQLAALAVSLLQGRHDARYLRL